MQNQTSSSATSAGHCWRLAVHDSFAAAHALRHYRGKCEHLHGHNFAVTAEIEGQELSEDTELLLDFGILKQGLKEVLSELDHRHLNEIPPFNASNPSSENLARHIFRKMSDWLANSPDMQAHRVRLASITVGESDKQSATYMEWQ